MSKNLSLKFSQLLFGSDIGGIIVVAIGAEVATGTLLLGGLLSVSLLFSSLMYNESKPCTKQLVFVLESNMGLSLSRAAAAAVLLRFFCFFS